MNGMGHASNIWPVGWLAGWLSYWAVWLSVLPQMLQVKVEALR